MTGGDGALKDGVVHKGRHDAEGCIPANCSPYLLVPTDSSRPSMFGVWGRGSRRCTSPDWRS